MTIYLSLGSNEGDRRRWLREAINMLGRVSGHIATESSIYQTAAWGLRDQPDFLNMAVQLLTDKSPQDLLADIRHIEIELGRQRATKWGPRTLDIDILFYGDEIISLPDLNIPHPYIQDRLFTLEPMAEIAPNYVHPVLHKTIAQLLDACNDTLPVVKMN